MQILSKDVSEVTAHERAAVERYALVDDLLYYNDERGPRLVIPVTPGLDHRQMLLYEFHTTALKGHYGVEKTYYEISKHFFWPRLYVDVVHFVGRCNRCLRDKFATGKKWGLLSAPSSDQPYPFHTWFIDEVCGLPLTESKHDQLWVCTERVVGAVVLIPTNQKDSAIDNACQYFMKVVCRYGMTKELYLDRLPKYLSVFWTTLFKLAGTQLNYSSAYHKSTMGQAERRNAVVEMLFRHLTTKDNVQNWDLECPIVEFQVMNSVYAPTGMAPNELLYGRLLDTPVTWLATPLSRLDTVPKVGEFASNLRMRFQRAKDALRAASDAQLEKLNVHRREAKFKVGDKVLLLAEHISVKHRELQTTRKFLSPYMGLTEQDPFTVVEVVSPTVVRLNFPASMKRISKDVNVALLKPFPVEGLATPASEIVDPQVDEPVVVREEGMYIVDKILDARKEGRNASQYLVKWAGYSDESNTWVPRRHLSRLAKKEADELFPAHAPKSHGQVAPAKDAADTSGGKKGKVSVVDSPTSKQARDLVVPRRSSRLTVKAHLS